VGFDVTDQLLIIFNLFVRYWRKNGSTMSYEYKLFMDFKKVYDSVRKELPYHSLIESE
jgi:hypothetical protein